MAARIPDTATDPDRPAGRKASFLANTFHDLDADPRFAWTTRRRNRLLLVATQAGILVLSLAMLILDQPLWALGTFLMFFPLMSLINIGIHGLLEIPVAHLDEVMVRLRTEAKAQAHTILVVLIGLTLVAAPFAAAFWGEQFGNDLRTAIVVPSSVAAALFLAALLLPRWILAWRLPDQH